MRHDVRICVGTGQFWNPIQADDQHEIDCTGFIEMIMRANLVPFKVVHETVRVHGNVAVVVDTSTDGKVKHSWIALRHEGQWRVISETISKVKTQK